MSQDSGAVMQVAALVPYARNARTHSDAQIAQLAASIREFGFTNPVLVDESGGIIAGHGRVLAARQLGMEAVPVKVIGADWSEAKKRAYILADNKLALNAGWDADLLRVELEDLDKFDLALTGFVEDEIAALFKVVDELALKAQNYHEAYSVLIECNDEREQKTIFDRMTSEGYKCRVQSL